MQSTPLEIQITRTLSFPIQDVYDAWTDPDALRMFWTPNGARVVEAEMDLTPGGNFRILVQGPGQPTPSIVTGLYKDIQAPTHLAYTWTFQEPGGDYLVVDSVVTVDLVPSDDGTVFALQQDGIHDQATYQREQESWGEMLAGLELYLAGPKPF